MSKNIVDAILRKIILKFLTKDEWHTAVIGFFDGLSFESKGKWMRKALADPDIEVDGIKVEKVWYYRVPYVFGELAKIGLVVLLVKYLGTCGKNLLPLIL